MKKFRTLFPFLTETVMPNDLVDIIESNHFDGLTGTQSTGSGWAEITEFKRVLQINGLILLRYRTSTRTADPAAVNLVSGQRIDEITAEGREVDTNMALEISLQARNEVIRYAPIKSKEVYLLICECSGFIYAAGSNLKNCEEALSYLRKSVGSLDAQPWGCSDALSNAVTRYMSSESSEKNLRTIPENIAISPFGKTIVTGEDSSLKAIFDGVKNDTDGVKSVIDGMKVRAVEMSYIERPSDGQLKNLADFELHMPAAGNVHFKKFDYDDDSLCEDDQQQIIAEMILVAGYTPKIIDALSYFAGFVSENITEDTQESLNAIKLVQTRPHE